MSEVEESELDLDPGEEAPVSREAPAFRWTVSMVGAVILLIGGLVLWPMILRQRKAVDRTRAIGNCKQIGLALLEFEQEFGAFPNEKTAELVRRSTKTPLDLPGRSTNAAFRQLVAFGIGAEAIYYCVHPEMDKKPDGDISPGKAIEAGETGYSYIAGFDTKAKPGIPLVLAPMRIGTEAFWEEPYGGKAVLLRADNSVEAPLIRRSDGKVPVGSGKTVFDTGADTVWGEGFDVDMWHPERR
ncbi:hypothetical protein ACFQY0_10615 [Haloferula chungangensis]|uniref:DUF1559 domain-containing protein n=1 Tax=Haloferula chungangensis TaxID=1048331 RepID=A0ABW2L7U9_9BACT